MEILLLIILSTIGYFFGWALSKKHTKNRCIELLNNTEVTINKYPSEKEKEAFLLGVDMLTKAHIEIIKDNL